MLANPLQEHRPELVIKESYRYLPSSLFYKKVYESHPNESDLLKTPIDIVLINDILYVCT